jgi:starch-binding outer membrane protein, SusD/RagB family
MKIKYFILSLAIVLTLGTISCDVERLPETEITDPTFWRSENDIRMAANYLYTFLPTLPVTNDVWSDDAFGISPNAISDGTRLPPATDANYNNPYRLIRAANNILEKAPKALESGVSQDVVNWYLAEARFFRAWAYFGLVQRYGNVPLILTTLTENDEKLFAPADPRDAVVNAIYEDLDFAISNLRTPTRLGAAGYGRIPNTAAMAFKSRVALFEGTFAKFHQKGDANRHLNLALNAAKACMDSGEHDVFGSYFDLFQYAGEGRANRENILVRRYGVSLTESVLFHNSQRNLETGAANPTKALVDSYLMVDGLPKDKSPLYQVPTTILEDFDNRDKRMSATLFKKGDPYIGTQPLFNVPNLSFQRTGYANRRYANVTDWQNSRSFIDYPIIRYAEVLLNYAEAAFELNGTISDQDLSATINRLRTRAGVAHLTNAFVSQNGLNMRDEIRRERRVELALEGFRYWDLIRWKTAEIELPKTVLGNYYFANEFGTGVTPIVDENKFIILQRSTNRSFDPTRDYLWPLPINELGLNPKLQQNPNW